jgi:hypothetical protein
VLIVSELSRIGRDTVRTPAAILQLEEAGVEIRSYLTTSAAFMPAATGSRFARTRWTPRWWTCW